MFAFRCRSCSDVHEGIPSFGWDYPVQYLAVPEAERLKRCHLTSDTCVVDDEFFFVRGCLEVPVSGQSEPLSWGVWTSLSAANFRHFEDLYEQPGRASHGPFFGWLSSHIWIYPDTLNLKSMVHLRDDGIRPFVELEQTDHPLAVEQRQGITVERVAEIYEAMVHGPREAG
jgi:hypothetical protein